MQRKAIIIGAGIAGIATAIRLAKKGYAVQVFEANDYPGGKLTEVQRDGFRFDAGPSLFTMPQYVTELFALCGKNPEQYFNYQELDVLCNYFYEDGTRLSSYTDVERFAAQVSKISAADAAKLPAFLAYSKRIYQITDGVFLQQSLHRLKTYLQWGTLKSVLRLGKIDAFRSMNAANQSFFSDTRLVQLFNRYATYNGSNPYQAPATLNVIPHLEQHYGAYFPRGGMHSITTSLVKLAEDIGVRFNYRSKVSQIELAKGKATGVWVGDELHPADVVVSNMDVWFTYGKLLAKHPQIQPKRVLRQERSSSALIFYWGVRGHFPELDMHNIFFSADYEAEFKAIWQQQNISADPTVYINITSKHQPADAPAGHENWFVMINVPANTGQNWDELIARAKASIIAKLNRALGINLNNLIVCEDILAPRSIEGKTSSYQGSLYGTSSNNQMAAFLRQANRSAKVPNLYFCGGSVHPGGGIPLALLSAKIVADWVK